MNKRFSKSLIILAAAGLLGSSIALAGNGPGNGDCDGSGDCTNVGNGGNRGQHAMQGRRDPAMRMAGMANRLGLSEEQQLRALELFQLQAGERAEMRAMIQAEFGDDFCTLRDQHREEFRALLTDEQRAQHDEMLQNRTRQGKRGGGQGFGGLDCPNDG